MNVELRYNTPLQLLVEAIRTCWDSGDQSDSGSRIRREEHNGAGGFRNVYSDWILGAKDRALVLAVIKKNHTSTLEHLTYNFKIEGMSRLVLQELARHRIASLSVKSTRYTLKELKGEDTFIDNIEMKLMKIDITEEQRIRAKKYINLTGNEEIDNRSILELELLRQSVREDNPNDVSKYNLCENYKVDLVWSINARSLRNFLQLRLAPEAHFEIRELAAKIKEAIPEDHKFLFKGI
jgi:thymidylate synthase (FAD)